MWLLGRWEVGRCSDTKEKALKPQNRKELGFVCVCVLGGEVVCFNVEEPKEGQMVLESKGGEKQFGNKPTQPGWPEVLCSVGVMKLPALDTTATCNPLSAWEGEASTEECPG